MGGEKKKKHERKFQSGRDMDGRRGLAAECAKCTTTHFKFLSLLSASKLDAQPTMDSPW
jgi:hypothetical protein